MRNARQPTPAGVAGWVWGRVEEIGGFVYVEVRALETARGREVFTYQDAGDPQTISDAMVGASEELATVFLGGPWAALTVQSDPDDAAIFVDGRFAAIGTSLIPYLSPGRKQVQVTAEGYVPVTAEVSVIAGQRAALQVTLSPVDTGSIVVSSQPPGARVYLDSRIQGVAPVTVPRPQQTRRLLAITDAGAVAVARVAPGSAHATHLCAATAQ